VFKPTESNKALDNNELVTERRSSPSMLAIWPIATSSCIFRKDPPPEDLQKIRPKKIATKIVAKIKVKTSQEKRS
jgi:hypothetical protein